MENISDIRGNPVIHNNIVYVISYNGKMVSLDLNTGKRIWESNIGGIQTPWVVSGFIFVLSKDNELICLTSNSGKVVWVSKLKDSFNAENQDDIIIISDLDEIPNLEKIDFKIISQKLIFFKQKMFYYKLNLFHKSLPWYGSKACKKKYFKTPEWLREIKNKKYPMWRLDILLSKFKYNDIYFAMDGGWHFSNIRKPEDLEKKLLNFLHHVDYKQSGLGLEDLKRLMSEKKLMYNHSIDKKGHKWGEGVKLQSTKLEEMPKYIIENTEKYRAWLDS
jgi:beta-1,4-mannosyl-glycoprotein beta-1,4-N-acetylglucosaminyltransferase